MSIKVLPYDNKWNKEFILLKNFLQDKINFKGIDIQHIGSTSVEGLWAKPIIDIDIIVEKENEKLSVINDLVHIGYNHLGNLGIIGREAFRLKIEQAHFFFGKLQFKHNLYLCKRGILSLENHLRFRDYLRLHPEECMQYSELKRKLAAKYPTDINSYTEAKTEFITRILNETGISVLDIIDITCQNKVNL